MLLGILRRKVSVDVSLEDGLTAATLGSLRYLDIGICVDWLKKARDRSGKFLSGISPSTRTLEDTLQLWPSLSLDDVSVVEPDALIHFPDLSIVFEAKLRSGKSQSSAENDASPSDQLARQFIAAMRTPGKNPYGPAKPIAVYVTAHVLFPTNDVLASEAVLAAAGYPDVRIFWVSWSDLARVLRSARSRLRREQVILVDDVLEYMTRALPSGVMPFDGWTAPRLTASAWSYRAPLRKRFTNIVTDGRPWRYGRRRRFQEATSLVADETATRAWRYGRPAYFRCAGEYDRCLPTWVYEGSTL